MVVCGGLPTSAPTPAFAASRERIKFTLLYEVKESLTRKLMLHSLCLRFDQHPRYRWPLKRKWRWQRRGTSWLLASLETRIQPATGSGVPTRPDPSPCSLRWANDGHILLSLSHFPRDIHSFALPNRRLSVVGRYIHDLTAAIKPTSIGVSFGSYCRNRKANHKSRHEKVLRHWLIFHYCRFKKSTRDRIGCSWRRLRSAPFSSPGVRTPAYLIYSVLQERRKRIWQLGT